MLSRKIQYLLLKQQVNPALRNNYSQSSDQGIEVGQNKGVFCICDTLIYLPICMSNNKHSVLIVSTVKLFSDFTLAPY